MSLPTRHQPWRYRVRRQGRPARVTWFAYLRGSNSCRSRVAGYHGGPLFLRATFGVTTAPCFLRENTTRDSKRPRCAAVKMARLAHAAARCVPIMARACQSAPDSAGRRPRRIIGDLAKVAAALTRELCVMSSTGIPHVEGIAAPGERRQDVEGLVIEVASISHLRPTVFAKRPRDPRNPPGSGTPDRPCMRSFWRKCSSLI